VLYELARGYDDGAPCPPVLLDALAAEIARRRAETDTDGEPASPVTSELCIRRSGLPDWWEAGENLLLTGPGARVPELTQAPPQAAVTGAVVVLGARSVSRLVAVGGERGLVVLGDDVNCHRLDVRCFDASTVLIGERLGATTNEAQLDCCNGGMIIVGADGMWAHGVSLITDDGHAIRDAVTGERLNTYGGRIVIERHVWLCELVMLLGETRVGADTVIGLGAQVANASMPANSVCVGMPARAVGSGVTWSQMDAP
jgi:acetyltransferase-like isoleucine patch superfamily enzyme